MVNDALTRNLPRGRRVNGANPELALAIGYAPPAARPALMASFDLDAALAAVLRTTREPLVGQMRLTWWHEALTRLDTAPPPAEPVLAALAESVLSYGVSGARLATMIDGWEELLDDLTGDEAMTRFAERRGGGLFDIAGTILAARPSDPLLAAGKGWALADLARHLRNREMAEKALSMARTALGEANRARWSRPARTLGALAHLALRDASIPLDQAIPVGSPGRVLRLAWHRMTGR